MKSSITLVGILMVYLVIGFVASETGLTEPIMDSASFAPQSPSDGGSLWDKLSAVLGPLAWAFNAVGGLFQLATYQSDKVPPLVNTLVFAPLGLILVFTGIKLVRGVST